MMDQISNAHRNYLNDLVVQPKTYFGYFDVTLRVALLFTTPPSVVSVKMPLEVTAALVGKVNTKRVAVEPARTFAATLPTLIVAPARFWPITTTVTL